MSNLDWPTDFERTPMGKRESYPHGFRVSRSDAFDNILAELRKLGARNVQLDTGAEHQQRNPNKPYANSEFDDPSVVVRFERDGQQYAIPCDRWDNPRDNGQAIARYIDAKRAIERYGVSTIESEFSTQALPSGEEDEDVVVAGAGRSAHEILGVSENAPEATVRGAYRELLKKRHPDHGGSTAEFRRLLVAKETLLEGPAHAE